MKAELSPVASHSPSSSFMKVHPTGAAEPVAMSGCLGVTARSCKGDPRPPAPDRNWYLLSFGLFSRQLLAPTEAATLILLSRTRIRATGAGSLGFVVHGCPPSACNSAWQPVGAQSVYQRNELTPSLQEGNKVRKALPALPVKRKITKIQFCIKSVPGCDNLSCG